MIDLIKKYSQDKQLLREIEEFSSGLLESHEDLKKGDIVTFKGGHDGNIDFKSQLIGFDKNGNSYVVWDCYWFPLNESRNLEKVID